MQLSWDGIVFDVVLLEDWVREAVYDPAGVDFLYWHHLLDVVVTVGGDANDRRMWPFMDKNMGQADQDESMHTQGAGAGAPGRAKFPMISPNGKRLWKDRGLGRDGQAAADLDAALSIEDGELSKIFDAPVNGRVAERPDLERNVPLADLDIRRRLQLPRRQLLVWTYSGAKGRPRFLLASPLTGVDTDCRHGPVCTVMGLPVVSGNVSGVFRLRFETWERPLDQGKSSQASDGDATATLGELQLGGVLRDRVAATPALISNRWKMRQEPDPETYLNTVVVEGTAVFRMDVLKVRQATPDMLRAEFLHPLAVGYVRQPPEVEVSPTGDGVRYQVVDHEVMTNFPAGRRHGLIRIDIQQATQYHVGFDMAWR